MNKKSMLTVLAALVFIMSSAFMAQGQSFRTFVSGTGNDTNSGTFCQQAAPCRTFATAISVTNAGGQVVALDSTGYAAFAVNKSITIEGAPGAHAFVFVGASGVGISVGGSASDLVVLRNIYVDGLGNASTTGLQFNGPSKLVVENCTFRSLTTGVSVTGTALSHARVDLINSGLYGNTTGVSANGTGTDRSTANNAAAFTEVRINGGNIIGNGTALFQTNPGTGGFTNILLLATANLGSAFLTNITGNTAALSAGTGTGCPAGVCTSPQLYLGGENLN